MSHLYEGSYTPPNPSIDIDDLTVFKVFLSLDKLNQLSHKEKIKFIKDHPPLKELDEISFKYWYNELKQNNNIIYIALSYPLIWIIKKQFKYTLKRFLKDNSEYLI